MEEDGDYSEWTYLSATRSLSSKAVWAEVKFTVEDEHNPTDIWIDDIAFCAGTAPCAPDPVTPGPASTTSPSPPPAC